MQLTIESRIGKWQEITTTGELVRAYVPKPLPPDPPLDLTPLLPLIESANRSLGRLDGMTSILPSTNLFVYFYLRKEALLSSQIEGTQSSLSELLLFEGDELPVTPTEDVREVSNYVLAMNHGLARIKDGFPLSLRLIREMHLKLLAIGRGSDRQPGEFRTSQNWIGGTRPGNAKFVPPPPDRLPELLGALEKYLNEPTAYPPLLRAALAHVQFETIHPFLDGNGRLGRLLITLILCEAKALAQPNLYLSLYLKSHRAKYYELLQSVRENGRWEEWIEFFLNGIVETADQGVSTAQRLLELFKADENRISDLGRRASSALRVHSLMQRYPNASVPYLATQLKLSQPTAQKAVDSLQGLGILREMTGRRRERTYSYHHYMAILDEGTEPLPR